MTPILTIALIIHVLIGVFGVICLYATLLQLLKKEYIEREAKLWSLDSLICIIVSWISGGFYYLTYYGAKVKPIILKGAYPWAHNLGTEWKEHVFLFLPFLSLAIVSTIFAFGPKLAQYPHIKKALITLTTATLVLGILITLSGIMISGGVHK